MKERYFSHDANARIDTKIVKIRRKYGMEGYGIYFALLEMMYGETEYSLPYNDDQFDAIEYDLHTDVKIGEFVAMCIDVGLFEENGTEFWSPSFRRRMNEIKEKADERSKRAVEAAKARWSRREETIKPEAQKTGLEDAGWLKFVKQYESSLGLIPQKKLIALSDYHDALGDEIMMLALEQTIKAKPDRPAPFLIAILQRWIESGVDSIQKARAAVLDHDRAVVQMNGKATEPKAVPADVGKFY